MRGILDGHVVLDRRLADRGRWPAIDPLRSLSRVMDRVTDEAHRDLARALREEVALYESKRDLVLLGAYEAGADPRLDAVLRKVDRIEAFLRQGSGSASGYEATKTALAGLRA